MTEETKRDIELFKEILRIYEEERSRTQTLNDKAISLATSSGTIMALFIGLSTFSLEHISTQNPYFQYITSSLTFGLTMFVATILISLFAFAPATFLHPNPREFIEEYADRSLEEYLHYYGGDLIDTINNNRNTNNMKVRRINWALMCLTAGLITIVIYGLLLVYAILV